MPRDVPPAKPRITVPTSTALPAWDLILADGRTLRYRGTERLTFPPTRGADGRIHIRQDVGGRGPHLPMLSTWADGTGLLVLASKHSRRLLELGTKRVIGETEPLLHVSLSYRDHDPTWEEIKLVRMAFYPADIDVAMILPALADYVNVQAHTFQMYQAPTAWGRE